MIGREASRASRRSISYVVAWNAPGYMLSDAAHGWSG
jgi:hypothetical protein